MFEIRKANLDDLTDVLNHYKIVINQIKNYDCNPQWDYGIYPTEQQLINSIELGDMYVGLINSKIVSSIIIDHRPIQQYDAINWRLNVTMDEAYYIHLLAVNQDYKKQGIAGKMLKFAFDLCKKEQVKTIRLSINKNNIGIEPVYLRNGFDNVDSIKVNDEKRGLLFFEIYDKII